MATIEKQPETALTIAEWQDADRSKASRYLSDRLTETRADYRSVAVATFVLATAVAGTIWLAFGILLEHWLLVGGMPAWLRWSWLLLGIAGLLAASIRWLIPLYWYRVNLLYAARSIEREFPELHNDLVNAVLVSPGESDPHGDLITRSLEQRAARQLTGVPADGVFDKHHLVRLAFVLALLVFSGTLYALVSPKDPFVTTARLFAPWSGWAAPSRVVLESVRCYWAPVVAADQPALPLADIVESLFDPRRELSLEGAKTQVIRGRQLVVEAKINRLRQEEVPLIRVTPLLDDGRIDPEGVPWQAELKHQGSEASFFARLPDSRIGLDRSLRLGLEAGDARWPPFDVLVVDAPSVLVREAVYHFPKYTGLPSEIREWQGDLRGLEGTEVKLHVESNQPLDAAWIDFLDTQRPDDLRMLVDREEPSLASVSLLLRRTADRSGPEHPSYRLRFRPQGDRDAGTAAIIDEPLTHRIDVLSDLAPEVSIDLPSEDPLRVPPRAPVRIRVRAVDPDYAVSSVHLETRPEGGTRPRQIMLWESAPERFDEASGNLRMSTRIVPAQVAGDARVLEYRAIVADNRQPEPNSTATPWRRLLIDERASPQPDPEQSWPKRRQPNAEPPAQGDDESQRQANAAGKPPQEPTDERPPERAAENQSPADRPPPDRQQPGQEANAEPGMQDASGTAGPQDGQGQQSSQQEPAGQPGSGEAKPTGENQSAGEPSGGRKGQEQNGGDGRDSEKKSQSQQAAEAAETNPEGQDSRQSEDSLQRQDQGSQKNSEVVTREQSRPSKDAAGNEGISEQGAPTTEAEQQQGKENSSEAPSESPVSADGTDDGEAMERILDHQRRQDQNPRSQKQPGEEMTNQEKCCPEEGKPCGKPGCASCNGGSGGAGAQGGGGKPSGASESQPGAAEAPNSGSSAASSSAGASSADAGEEADGKPDGGEGQPGKVSEGTSEAMEASGSPKDGGNSAGEALPSDASNPSQSTENSPAGQSSSPSKPLPAGSQSAGQGDQAVDGTAAGEKKVGEADGASQQSAGGGAVGGEQASSVAGEESLAPVEPVESQQEDFDAERHAVDLAMTHLRDSVRSGDDGILEELGWSQEQAEAFLDRWEAMQQAAEDSQQQRQDYERAVRSLGLRPTGVRTSRQLFTDREGKRLESRRTQPPLEYRERFKAYQKGTGSGRVETE